MGQPLAWNVHPAKRCEKSKLRRELLCGGRSLAGLGRFLPLRALRTWPFDLDTWKNDHVGGLAGFILGRLADPVRRELDDSTHGIFSRVTIGLLSADVIPQLRRYSVNNCLSACTSLVRGR